MLDTAQAMESQRTLLEWLNLPTGWARLALALLLVALCGLTIMLYLREARSGAKRSLRGFLASLRCVVIVGLALIWLAPALVTYAVRLLPARVVVLVDASASMAVSDVADAPRAGSEATPASTATDALTRAAAVTRILSAEDHAWLRRLEERNRLSVYAFGEATRRVALPWEAATTQPDSGALIPPVTPDLGDSLAEEDAHAPLPALPPPISPRSDLGEALQVLADELSGQPVAGVAILSDGAFNRGPSLAELIALAQRAKLPLYPIGIGSETEPPNWRLASIAAPAAVPPDDPFVVEVQVLASGLADEEAQVKLSLSGPNNENQNIIATQRVSASPAGQPAALRFEVSPPEPGEYVYRAHVRGNALESVADDNVRETRVQVLDDKLRVLVVAGGPTYDYRLVTRLLERDKSIDVSCWLQSADPQAVRDGNIVITKLPREPAELFAYDIILLVDPDPAELDSSWCVLLRRWVEELGGGLFYQAGPHFSTRLLRDPRLQELVAILPFTSDPDAAMRLTAAGTYQLQESPLRLTPAAATHPITSLAAESSLTEEVWRALPGVWWHLPALRAKPLATVLLEHGSTAEQNQYGPALLLAVQPVGAGRTASLLFDSTWRWRAAAEPYFNRFWIQLMRYLAQARRQDPNRRGEIVLDRETFSVGDYVKLEVQVLDASFAPLPAPEVSATLTWQDGQEQMLSLAALPGRAGWFTGRVLLEREGAAVLRVALPGADGTAEAPAESAALKAHLLVTRPDVELRALRLRTDTLQVLAQETGGEYLPGARAGELPDLIRSATRRQPPQQVGQDAVWDSPYWLAALALLLTLEWSLRRRHHLL